MIHKKGTLKISKKVIHIAVRVFILIATFVAIYVFFISVAAQLTSIRISETLTDMGSARVTTSPATEFKEKNIVITRQTAGSGDLSIGISLSNVLDYTVVAGGGTQKRTDMLSAAQNNLSLSIPFLPSNEG